MSNHSEQFGFQKTENKQSRVRDVFSSVASKYDIMNDFMSAGLHRIWKDKFVASLNLFDGMKILDLAGGTGDITKRIMAKAKKQNINIEIILSDINPEMLAEGKKRAIDENWAKIYNNAKLSYEIINAEEIPFEDGEFDLVTISFGIRNVSHIEKALSEISRTLRLEGEFNCLEFSKLNNPILAEIYKKYSFNIIPKIGKLVANDEASYQYLVESIELFPTAENFANMIENVGLKNVSYNKMTKGIVAHHKGVKNVNL